MHLNKLTNKSTHIGQPNDLQYLHCNIRKKIEGQGYIAFNVDAALINASPTLKKCLGTVDKLLPAESFRAARRLLLQIGGFFNSETTIAAVTHGWDTKLGLHPLNGRRMMKLVETFKDESPEAQEAILRLCENEFKQKMLSEGSIPISYALPLMVAAGIKQLPAEKERKKKGQGLPHINQTAACQFASNTYLQLRVAEQKKLDAETLARKQVLR